ncbi:LAFE_0E12904g1_1 [Lachancea fermentati]|uniref:LAFE_0E12904g1_1 n=1 Tax=Lachancea fermentati TaxID=4955 RepID=A0A1G4MDY0_LACFM|nr:LAFE_0E12904g1_1 [Lachancea fermentati]
MDPQDIAQAAGVSPVELCVYSILSNNLDGIYQSINELRESQALLILRLRQVRDSLKGEQEFLNQGQNLKVECERLENLKTRVDALVKRCVTLLETCNNLT